MNRECEVEGCGRVHYAGGYCEGHYRRKKAGRAVDEPLRTRRPRAKDPNRNYTGRYTDTKGYVRIYRPGHPNAHANGWMYEHVFVLYKELGRPLEPGEHVHHLNGVKHDNRAENLELWANIQQPSGQRINDLVAWAIEILRHYDPARLVVDGAEPAHTPTR